MPKDPLLLSPAELADRTGIPLHAVRRLIRKDRVSYYVVGRRQYLKLDEFLNETKREKRDEEERA